MDVNELLKQMQEAGFQPTENEDSGGFKHLKGEYIATVNKVERKTGVSKGSGKDYDLISINAQVQETVNGDKGDNRYLDGLTFSLTTEFGLPSFINSCFTAGVELDRSSVEALVESAQALVGKAINVRAWEKNGYQQAKIVKAFKSAKSSEEVPF